MLIETAAPDPWITVTAATDLADTALEKCIGSGDPFHAPAGTATLVTIDIAIGMARFRFEDLFGFVIGPDLAPLA